MGAQGLGPAFQLAHQSFALGGKDEPGGAPVRRTGIFVEQPFALERRDSVAHRGRSEVEAFGQPVDAPLGLPVVAQMDKDLHLDRA